MSAANPVRSKLRTLLRLIQRIPSESQRASAFKEARTLIRTRSVEPDTQTALGHQRELAAKIAYLKVVTPKQADSRADSAAGGATYVLREGKLVEGSGETRGSRVNDGQINMNEAVQRNNKDFKRFYGGNKPGSVFF